MLTQVNNFLVKNQGLGLLPVTSWPSWPRRPRDNEQILRAKSLAQQILDTH